MCSKENGSEYLVDSLPLIVLRPRSNTLTKTKIMLDDMHKRKIDMSDEIFVINVGGYIGSSTKSEIEYAELNLHFLMAFREALRATCCQQLYGKTWSEFVESNTKWELDVQS